MPLVAMKERYNMIIVLIIAAIVIVGLLIWILFFNGSFN